MLFYKIAFLSSFFCVNFSAGFFKQNHMRNVLKPIAAEVDLMMNWSKYAFPPHLNDCILRLRVFSNCQMTVPIGIGTPVQWFNLSLDFLTPNTIMLMEKIDYFPESRADPQIYGRKIFEPDASSTFLNYSRSFSHLFFGDGYLAADVGYNYKKGINRNVPHRGNSMSGPLFTNKMDFMMLTKIGYIFGLGMQDVPADGILGLAPMEEAEYGIKSFTSWLMAKWGGNNSKITLFLNNFNADDPDEMKQNSFALVDFGSSVNSSPLPTICAGDEWFNAPLAIPNTWSLVAKKIYAIFDEPSSSSQKWGTSTATDVVFGENRNVTIVPTDFYIRIPKARMMVLKDLLHASDDVWPGLYQLPCNSTKFAPKIKFDFESQKSTGQKLSIEFAPHEYILPSQYNDCELIFTHASLDKITFYQLGYSFFQKHCLQLFYSSSSESSVGLAPKKK